jgi:D-alanyl-lipoteichoic acid acyltransferase DltB (MBOAT superfamily)
MGMRERLVARTAGWETGFIEAQSFLSRTVARLGGASRTFRMLLQSLILSVGALLVIDGKASGGVIIASSVLSGRALAPVDQAIANWKGLVAARAGWGRDLPVLEIILPVGISFFTFQGMSYLIDIARRQTAPASFLDITLLMSFFPHLVAGPIVRASHLVPQFKAVPRLTRGMVATALILICWGLFKKTVVASELATGLVDKTFFDPSAQTGLDLALGAYGYAVQIYCDFSAYSGGIGPKNFDAP